MAVEKTKSPDLEEEIKKCEKIEEEKWDTFKKNFPDTNCEDF